MKPAYADAKRAFLLPARSMFSLTANLERFAPVWKTCNT
jgi:hypothetical protein